MKTKISMACQKSIEWQPCDLRNTKLMKKTACTMPRGQVGDTCMLHKFQLASIGGSSRQYCCRSCPQVYVGSPVLYKANISKVNVYSLLSCPYLHCRALALANGDRLLLPLGN